MASEERTKEVLKALHVAVVKFEEDDAVRWAKIALEEGIDAYSAVVDGLADGMREAGDLYDKKVYFVPELLLCSDALYAGLEILKPAIMASGKQTEMKGSIILGVMEGDVHDIGKNLVKVMFEAAGWDVHDLGRDVPLDTFVEEQEKTNCDIVGLSTLMTTSMLGMPVLIKKLREKNPAVQIMIGGAPISRDIAEKYGADGYADNAGTAVDEAVKLLQMQKRRRKPDKYLSA